MNKVPGLDGLHPQVLKMLSSVTALSLFQIFRDTSIGICSDLVYFLLINYMQKKEKRIQKLYKYIFKSGK